MKRDELVQYLNDLLHINEFSDLGPNGLQVEGRSEIRRVVTGVSACVELFERAIALKADAIIVHHGIIWEFERPVFRGGYKKRVKLLLEHNINLLAYHLPLDAHEQFGNNIRIAKILGLQEVEPFGEYKGKQIGFKGRLAKIPEAEFLQRIKEKINTQALIFPFGPKKISTVGIISGGAQKDVKQAVAEGLDAFITGEASEHILHYAKEEGIHFIAAGHHATERFGVLALGDHLREMSGLEVHFVDIPNPV